MNIAGSWISLVRALVKARVDKGLSQDEIAKGLSVTRQALSAWEQGVNFPPGPKLLLWAALVGVRMNFETATQSAMDDCAKEAA
ncbi:helix-turn-helix domain-containing protein [Azospirillum argentinense]